MSSIGEDVPKFWLKKASTALLKLCIKTLDENFEKRTAPGSVPDLSYWEQPQGLYTGKQKMKTYLEIHKVCDSIPTMPFLTFNNGNSILMTKSTARML